MMISNNDPGKDVMFVENTGADIIIDDYDKKMLSYIVRLYQALNGEKLDITKIQSAVDALQEFNMRNEYRYLNNLLHPEKCKGVKIPSQIPVPSCSFQLHNCVTLRTNASGNLCVVFNPYFLCNSSHTEYMDAGEDNDWIFQVRPNFYSSLFVNNDNSLNGYTYNDNFLPINIGQEIPAVYDQYRLVSASMVIKYIGRLDTVSGVIGGAVVFDETPQLGVDYATKYTRKTDGTTQEGDNYIVPDVLAKYGNFDLAMDAFYRQENLCLEGIRQLYFPIDNSYEEYTRLMNDNLVKVSPVNTTSGKFKFETTEDYLKNGFRQVVYVLGAPANQACFKLDIYCNFECLPSSPFLNYLPLSMNTEFASPEIKKKAGVIVQQKPIMKANEEIVTSEPPSIWQRLKNKFMDSLPGISKLITTGLVSAIPQLQLGTTLANTMSTIASGINSVINPTPTQAPSMSTVAQTTNPNNNLSLSQIPLSNSTIVVPVPSNSANI